MAAAVAKRSGPDSRVTRGAGTTLVVGLEAGPLPATFVALTVKV